MRFGRPYFPVSNCQMFLLNLCCSYPALIGLNYVQSSNGNCLFRSLRIIDVGL